jgi:transposase
VVERRGYPSGLTDERWALIEPVITAWKAVHPPVGGQQGRYAMREIINAIFYQGRTGCQWAYLPADLLPPGAVTYYFYSWRDDGTTETIHEFLRCQVRERAGRAEDPSLVVLDSQSVHAAVNVPAATTGKDAGERVPGRKRGIAVDIIGLIIAVVVSAASVHENTIGTTLLDQLTGQVSELEAELADLATTRKVLLTLETYETERGGPTNLPDNPVYQHILTPDRRRPARARERTVPCPGDRPRTQAHRGHALQAQAPGQPRAAHRNRAGPVRPTPRVIQRR